MKLVAARLQDYIRNKSPLGAYDKTKHSGFWRQLDMRTTSSGQSE